MKKTKEEIIKEAYSLLNIINKQPSDLGWISIKKGQYEGLYSEFDIIKRTYINWSIRPKSLQGIENNNGWIKIESEDYLPKEYGEFYFRTTYNPSITYTGWYSSSDKKFYDRSHYFDIVDVTHYQPIIKPKPPLY